jgi:phosphoserine phosphatase
MSFILSLIAGRGATEIGAAPLDRASIACARAGATPGEWRWLESGRAAECDLASAPADLLAQVREALKEAAIDVNLTRGPAAERRKRVLICDMDATAIEGETLDDLSAFTPFKAEIDALTRRSVEGKDDFADTLAQRVAMLKGLDLGAFERAHALVRPSHGIRTLVATMRGHGALAALVSGGFRYFTSRVREELGFEIDIANELEIEDGLLTGRLASPIVGPEAKVGPWASLPGGRERNPARSWRWATGPTTWHAGRRAWVSYLSRQGQGQGGYRPPGQPRRFDGAAVPQGYRRDEFIVPEGCS